MTRFSSVFAMALTLCSGALVACASDAEREADGASESELRALTSAEVVGEIAYGHTEVADYSDTPLYRAFEFDAAAGDEFEIWVRSSTGDARAWLLSSTFATLVTNKDANASTRDAYIRRKVTRSGTYYIAFRDENREDNTFSVSLQKLGANGGGGGGGNNGGSGAPVDPFDDALANAPLITASEAAALFAPGSSRTELGDFAMAERTRTCNVTTGCTPWSRSGSLTLAYMTYETWNPGAGWQDQKSCWKFGAVPYASVKGTMAMTVSGANRFDIELSSAATGDITCKNGTSGPWCDAFESKLAARPDSGASCNLPNRVPTGDGFVPTAYPWTVPLYESATGSNDRLSMSLRVTSKFVLGRSHYESKADHSGTTNQTEYALYGLIAKGTTPRL